MKFYQWKRKRLSVIIKSQQKKEGQSEPDTQRKSMKIILTKKKIDKSMLMFLGPL